MSRLPLPRWTAVLALSLLAGALLLMHGLDAGTASTGTHGLAAAAPAHADHAETPAGHHDAGCEGCSVGHVMATCVAIVVTVAGLRAALRTGVGHSSTVHAAATASIRAARQLLRPPEPAWVRLAVMRC